MCIETKRNKCPIFIFGSARSGTSLLSRIIGNHPNIAVPFESHLYNTFYPWLKYYGDLGKRTNAKRLINDILCTDVLQSWDHTPSLERISNNIERYDFHGIVDALISAWAKDYGKIRWGEKTPWHAFYWREIINGFPKAKIIHIVRDGRDSSISWKKARFGPKHYYHLATRWVRYLDIIDDVKKEIDKHSFTEIRYEDLLNHTEKVIQDVCSFLNEEFDSGMLEFYTDQQSYPTDIQNDQNLRKPILKTNTGKWRKEMNQRDLRIFETVAGEYLDKYGYERSIIDPKISNYEKLYIKFFEHPPKRIISMVKNRKGHRDAYQKAKIYLKLRFNLNK
jgi:hypothetical protein